MLHVYSCDDQRGGFKRMFAEIQDDLLHAKSIGIGEWQSQKTALRMRELINVAFNMRMPSVPEVAARETGAHLPWAEDHFLERVGGQPLNPSPSEAWWPFAKRTDDGTNKDHKSEGEAFSHTYPERMWSKYPEGHEFIMHGIRFDYGDLNDVVALLKRQPATRQAFLPIWFPEDGQASLQGKRVPCTLGYHFIIRDHQLHISYFMRSTDLLRHFQDDIYLAIRLAQWVCEKFNDGLAVPVMSVGELNFHTVNMHIFDDDVPMIDMRKKQGQVWIELMS